MVDFSFILCYNRNMQILEKINLFWDIDRNEIDPQVHGSFVVERILEKGDMEDIAWAVNFYGQEFVRNVFQKNSNKFDLKSNNFWCLYFNLNKTECTRKQSTRKQSPFWQR